MCCIFFALFCAALRRVGLGWAVVVCCVVLCSAALCCPVLCCVSCVMVCHLVGVPLLRSFRRSDAHVCKAEGEPLVRVNTTASSRSSGGIPCHEMISAGQGLRFHDCIHIIRSAKLPGDFLREVLPCRCRATGTGAPSCATRSVRCVPFFDWPRAMLSLPC